MSGPLLLIGTAAIIFMLWKYSENIKSIAAKVTARKPAGQAGPSTGTPANQTDVPVPKSKVPKLSVILTSILVLAAAVVAWLGLYGSSLTAPSFEKVGEWGANHWFGILILWGILAAAIAINAKALGKAAGVLQKALAVTVVAVVLAYPTYKGASGVAKGVGNFFGGSSATAAAAPHVALAEWHKIVIPPGGETEFIEIPRGAATRLVGANATVSVVYWDGHTVPVPIEEDVPGGPIKGFSITNNLQEANNTVSYEFH